MIRQSSACAWLSITFSMIRVLMVRFVPEQSVDYQWIADVRWRFARRPPHADEQVLDDFVNLLTISLR